MTTTTQRPAPRRRRSRAQHRGAYPCPVPDGATPDLMAAFERAMSADHVLTVGSCALDSPPTGRLVAELAERGADLPIDPDADDCYDEHPSRPRDDADKRHRTLWPDAQRRDAILGSEAAFLLSFAVSWVLSGVLAYLYALWTLGPV